MFYRTGTASFTNGSTSVAGVGTDWTNGAAVGECMQAPDGKLYEILSITSATGITLGSPYLGATAAGQAYAIIPTQAYIRDLAGQAATLVNEFAGVRDSVGAGKFGDGTQAIPAVRFTADEDTGVRRLASNSMALVAGAVDQLKAGVDGIRVTAADKATPVGADTVMLGDSAATGVLRGLTWANLKAALLNTWKDATGGLVGMTLFSINFKNAANTFTSLLANANTAARTYTFPDKTGTVAMTSDFAAPGPIGGATPAAVTATTLSATGDINAGSGSAQANVVLNSSYSTGGNVRWFTAGIARWLLGTADAESGSNAGANMYLYRYGDNGAYLDTALSINRATGAVALVGPVALGATLNVTGNTLIGAVTNPYSSRVVMDGTLSVLGSAMNTAPGASLHFEFVNRNGAGWSWYTNSGSILALTLDGSGHLIPGNTDATKNLGAPSNRWSTVYAGTGTINTSDAREKTPVRPLTANEINAAKSLSAEIGAYKFLDAVAAKGDAAREHIGMTVQRVIEIMQAHGLSPFDYGFVCHDAWDDAFVNHPAIEAVAAINAAPAEYVTVTADEVVLVDGVETTITRTRLQETKAAVQTVAAVAAVAAWTEQTQTAGNRYGFRMDELLMFISRGFEARLSALESA